MKNEYVETLTAVFPEVNLDMNDNKNEKENTKEENICCLYISEKNIESKMRGFNNKKIIYANRESELKAYNVSQEVDTYICKNICSQFARRKSEVIYVLNIVIDIDCHLEDKSGYISTEDSKHREVLISSLISLLNKRLKRYELYTLLVKSGRGIQLWFNFKEERMSSEMEHLYDSAVKAICNVIQLILNEDSELSSYMNIDLSASKNLTGLARLPGSYNTVSKTTVVSEQLNINSCPISLKSLYSKYVKLDLSKKDDNALIDSLLAIQKIERNRRKSLIESHTKEETELMLQNRLVFLIYVQSIRKSIKSNRRFVESEISKNKKELFYSEMRKVTLFLYYLTAYELYDSKEIARSKAIEFNQNFYNVLSEDKLTHTIESIEYDLKNSGARWFTNKTFVEMLKLTSADEKLVEQYKYLLYADKSKYIRNAEEKRKRAKLKETQLDVVKNLYLKGNTYEEIAKECNCSISNINNLVKKLGLSENDELLVKIQKFKHKGLTQKEISKKMNMSLRTIKRYWNK